MAASTYDDALARVLAHEGGYVNHPSDPGGPTNFGITLAEYSACKGHNGTAADARAMPLADAKVLSRAPYWGPLRGDDLPAGLASAVCDYGVNSGTTRAAKVLQRVCGLADDGRLTDAVIAAVRTRKPADVIAQVCDERLAFLKRLKTWPTFGTGWSRRVADVREAALAMANGAGSKTDAAAPHATVSSAPSVALSPASGKGVVPVNAPARTAVTAGIVAVGAGITQQAHHAGLHSGLVVAVVVVTVMLAVAGWLAWHEWQKRRQEARVTVPGPTAVSPTQSN